MQATDLKYPCPIHSCTFSFTFDLGTLLQFPGNGRLTSKVPSRCCNIESMQPASRNHRGFSIPIIEKFWTVPVGEWWWKCSVTCYRISIRFEEITQVRWSCVFQRSDAVGPKILIGPRVGRCSSLVSGRQTIIIEKFWTVSGMAGYIDTRFQLSDRTCDVSRPLPGNHRRDPGSNVNVNFN